ncbi:MAG: DUF262 domain-containing protein, partial [Erysipelotrichaceae bacterium]
MTVNYKIETWSLEKVQILNQENQLILPHFQRTIRWDPQRKAKLIDTMRQGNPIGTFLVYHDEDLKKFQIIDGLQRISTIIDYLKNPMKYVDDEILDFDLVASLREIKCNIEKIKFDPNILQFQINEDRKNIVKLYKHNSSTKASN